MNNVVVLIGIIYVHLVAVDGVDCVLLGHSLEVLYIVFGGLVKAM